MIAPPKVHQCPRHGTEPCGVPDTEGHRCGFPPAVEGIPMGDARYHACNKGPEAWMEYVEDEAG